MTWHGATLSWLRRKVVPTKPLTRRERAEHTRLKIIYFAFHIKPELLAVAPGYKANCSHS